MALARSLEVGDSVRWRSPFYFSLEPGVVDEKITDGRRLQHKPLNTPAIVVDLDRGGTVLAHPGDVERVES